MNLFCFPFAGANKYSYKIFLPYVAQNIVLIPLELPGRGVRMHESLLFNISQMANDLYHKIKDDLWQPYAFFGHSMGTVLAYQVIRIILSDNQPPPVHLFVSSHRGPSVKEKERSRHLLPRNEFIQELKDMGGSPDEILNNDDLMDFYEPILKADFTAIETYVYDPSDPFDIPITVMTGLEEKITNAEIEAWKIETNTTVVTIRFPGKHFFIFDFSKEIAEIINNILKDTRR